METPSVVAPATLEDAIASTADISQPQPQPLSHQLDSLPVDQSSEDFFVSETPLDDDFDQERNSGEDRYQDHGDNPVATDAGSVEELKQKIIRQVEYYFSDENLPTDKFLLSTMKRNKKGFVPISTIATFRKLKKLTQDHALIVSALKESSFLVVSQDGKKVKRLSPLPEVRDPKFFTVLVENLPEDHSDENIREIFGKVGSIKSVSICDPNAVEESDKGCKKDKFIRTRLHAFVEYETVEAAEKAAATLNNEQDWRNGLRVKLLDQVVKFVQKKPARREADAIKDNTGRVYDQTGGEESKKAHDHQHHRHYLSDNPVDDDKNGNRGSRGRGRGRRPTHQGGNGHGTSPSSSSSFHQNYHSVEVSKPLPGPKMPDGTRGFTVGRGKPLPPPASA